MSTTISTTGPWEPTRKPYPEQSTTNIRRLQVFQNKQFMHVINAPWYVRRKVIHDDLTIDPISEFIKKTSIRFFDKLPRFIMSCYKDLPTTQLSPVRGNVQELRWMLSSIISLPPRRRIYPGPTNMGV
ncbi:hypothetical protein AVEN_202750-1 [Araneus ventricosus]|uniref:Uncharacterized protein n=1 Tax=Araneus ventricosus TaxID=182803 RepID=A0A4Y2SCX7_ARAVE|nr:hypothetical protein AVEN_202750-1 [Araneus ventricosus]